MPDPAAAPTSFVASSPRFPVFALVWAVTALTHQLAFTFWAETWQGWLLVVSAIAVLFRPQCFLRFLALALCSLVNLWNKMPYVPNHILYEGMLHLVILLGAAAALRERSVRAALAASAPSWRRGLPLLALAGALKAAYLLSDGVLARFPYGVGTTLLLVWALARLFRRSDPVLAPPQAAGAGSNGEPLAGERLYLAAAPVLRAAVVAMYFWAGVQKLNHDYLDPEVSCAARLHLEIATYFGGLVPTGTWALQGAIWSSYLFEFGIPLLLLFGRTRLFGLGAALLFHLWLSIHPAAGIFSFSSLILGLLPLFFPVSWYRALAAVWHRQTRWLGRGDAALGGQRARWLVVAAFFGVLVAQGVLYLTQGRNYEVFAVANRLAFFAFLLWGLWLGACYLLAALGARREAASEEGSAPTILEGWRAPALVWLGLLPVLLNGAVPWIGGRTQTSFSMYSNLRSEGDGNHLFLRRIDWLPLQTDFVEVVASTPDLLGPGDRPRGIAQFANPGHRFVPWFEFRRLVSEMPGDFSVIYRRDAETEELGRRDGDPYGDAEAFEAPPYLQRKLLWFRRHESLAGPMCCTH